MTRPNKLTQSPPYPVEQNIKQLGENLRVARIRRDMTIAEAADRIGTGPRAVMDAEKGKSSTGMAVYAALLWLYNLLEPLGDLADPASDKEGMTLESLKARRRVRAARVFDNDF